MAELEVVFDERAEHDVRVAVEWYENQQNGLGTQFVSVIDESVERIQQFPRMFPTVMEGVRRALTKRFPYAVYFQVSESALVVLAVLHNRQDRELLDDRVASERQAERNGASE